MRSFRDRREAGRLLAERLEPVRGDAPVVLGLPRGGVPVAFEVARTLGAPLDVIVVRKLGVPFQPELGMGAVGEDGVLVLNDEVVALARVRPDEITTIEARERAEVERRARRFRAGRPRIDVTGRTVVVVDDGIATGGTARAAIQVARAHGAGRVVLAVPVGAPDTIAEMRAEADEVVCLDTPRGFFAVGQFYDDFTQTTDDQVVALLAEAADRLEAAPLADDPPGFVCDEEVEIAIGDATLAGHLTVPTGAPGVVVFAHGSGSSRHSPRNRFVAQTLVDAGLGTLLLDLLTVEEERDRANVFDVDLLAARLAGVTEWVGARPELSGIPVAYFGASTGAAAALAAAARLPGRVAAIVSRGGRPDLAGRRLAEVDAPTLLVVGGADDVVLQLNREAAELLRSEHELVVVPGATHLFEEPGALEVVADLARRWFCTHLAR
jgi:putative phosphoribosyl transferase